MSSSKLAVLAALLSAALCGTACAAALVVGPHYPVDEPDVLQWIERRLAAKQASGELAAKVDAAIAETTRQLAQPVPLAHISRASSTRTSWYDPSHTAERDVLDQHGRILVPAGTRVNPLDTVSLGRSLIFFDGRDPDQAAFAKRFIDSRAGRARPVLTGGSYFALMRQWRIPVYYDQRGLLTRRFGIRHVPAIVAQDGQRLRIDEIAL